MTPRPTRRRLLAAAPLILAIATAPTGSRAQFTVFDPTNYAQNLLTASRSLEQINHQITALQNQAQSLVNEARNLQALPFSALQTLQSQLAQTRALVEQAKGVAMRVADIDAAFGGAYRPAALSASGQDLLADAKTRWTNSVAAFQDALKVQAGVVGNLDASRTSLDQLVTSSQSASGALQAAQAGNQLLALQSQQLSDLLALLAAQGRAQTLEAAQRAAAQDQAREQLRRFLTPGAGYQPGSAKMFNQP
ncbi:P-type conjugative transfer protein TrbJ [Caulobacter rhizosphaerae]|uniref:P-type conjugative transfer protein TrbJ n=1 Tax=Caulobacter rhizosphaerae TaxID=2010972 RepID=A0ABU1MW39_9CAUL|nr:P-type conjugative transfer protein TrbJ [Caulobacter rhizosphaerae]MDR6530242.1 P-type conjugative transfer protein TrbJ [Caulobacter rhizosphaerae]